MLQTTRPGVRRVPTYSWLQNKVTPSVRGCKDEGEEKLDSVRHDFYQTVDKVMASLYLKKIDKTISKVEFQEKAVDLDLRTSDRKRFQQVVPLFGTIDKEKSEFSIMGTKLELRLIKADGASWPVLREDEKHTGEIIQMGRAGRA
jgi:hypothetical protein